MQACEQEVAKSQAKYVHGRHHPAEDRRHPRHGPVADLGPGHAGPIGTETTDLPDQDVFTPGSTAKVITAAAAFEHGGQTPDERLQHPVPIYRGGQCDPRRRVRRPTSATRSRASSRTPPTSACPRSTRASRRRSSTTTCATSASTSRPASASRGETPGPPAAAVEVGRRRALHARLRPGHRGQRVQMASVYATIANDGVRVQPRLVEGTYNAAGQYTPAPPSKSRQVIQTKTAKELISILQQVPGVDETANQPWGIIPSYASRPRPAPPTSRRTSRASPAPPATRSASTAPATSAWRQATARRSSSR